MGFILCRKVLLQIHFNTCIYCSTSDSLKSELLFHQCGVLFVVCFLQYKQCSVFGTPVGECTTVKIVTLNPADLFICGKRDEQRTILNNDVQKLLNDEVNVCLPVYRAGHQNNLMELLTKCLAYQ